MRDFNRLVGGKALGDHQCFAEVSLRRKALDSSGQNSKEDNRTIRNRMLIEGAYPQELSSKQLFKKKPLERKSGNKKPI